ncbi:apolipoprotein N-acyltransferase [Haloactinospora alba]|uniref:apolipoprotein N-acyltransferase n=1 Tax=Haloactinospora alba TaxID=405555 RepID=UPI001FE9911F|nr:apolipoprotein N-acyltransferase [Haloactinospora alba]
MLAAAGAGAAQLLALPPYGLWWLGPLSATLLVLAVSGTRLRRAAWLGAVSGASLMVWLVNWQSVFGVDVWLALAAAETLYFLPLATGIAWVVPLRGWPVWTAALWVLQEAVRARFPFGGFPWGKLAFAQPDTPFTGYAAVGSSALVTFGVALCGALLAAAVPRAVRLLGGTLRRANERSGGRVIPVVGLLATAVAIPALGPVLPSVAPPETDHTATVGMVQGDVPAPGQENILGERMQVLDNHMQGVHRIARQVRSGEVEQPDMVILPENASDLDAYDNPTAASRIADAARDVGAPLLVGITKYEDGGAQREVRSVVWKPDTGAGDYYTKRYLVPFGEYIPFRGVMTRYVSRLEQVTSDAVPGEEPGKLSLNGTTVAASICFDVVFDRPVRESVAAGGQILVVPTNNANYNFTGQPDQQLAITQLRAVEHGRPAVVASTSGVSAVVAPDGTVVYRSPEAEPDTHVTDLPAMAGETLATRLGALPEAALSALGVGALVAAAVSTIRRKHQVTGEVSRQE